ncbi:dermonecrotic toxin domain-containing protein [Pseudomonas sp. Teo4]|uniref:dermonecrotic toxin domain-containing protein n=1 Tax=Pseudomonas sp. Teo4 TaxID=3064528 RepID=UPI002ABA6DD2|nr:DUF6543 domain-containing protein [Pseudomonas sp. Teo4]MDZ3994148.1 hypothetical protein [Pseudomonas sp. Teo4]
MTPTPQSQPVHYTTIASKTPPWMKAAPQQTLQALREALNQAPATLEQACRRQPEVAKALAQEHQAFRDSKADVTQLFAQLPSIDAFATKKLSEAIKTTFGLDLDVNNTYLYDALAHNHWRQTGKTTPERFVRSLKQHALQNFEVSATQAGGLDVAMPPMRSAILDAHGYQNGPPFNNVVNIEPTAFATLCRKLDIGGQYFKLLDTLYYPEPTRGESKFEAQAQVLDRLGRLELSAFRQSLHLAALLGAIEKPHYQAVLNTPFETKAEAASPQATFSFLTLWGVELTGMMLISFAASTSLVLYNPHDRTSAIREFRSLDALRTHLRDRFQQDTNAISMHIPDARKAELQEKLLDLLMPRTFTLKNIYERVADKQAVLPIAPRELTRPLRAELIYQAYTRRRDDAIYHAVPTRAMDAKTTQARLAYFESLAFNALTLVGLAVPEVGYLMLAATALQLSYEVYEGLESWANDDRQQAFDYLMDVVENVALLTLAEGLGGAIKAELAARLQVPVQMPTFIEQLQEVEVAEGDSRLWQPDLTPYAQQVSLPLDASADAQGLRHHQGKTWLVLDGKTYAVKSSASNGEYRIEHPDRAHAYQPPLRHNGAGAWLHALDKPTQWQGLQLFRRLGHLTDGFDDATAVNILRVSGIDEGVLRRVLSENQALPAPLLDTLQRFKLDQQVMQDLADATPHARQVAFDQRYGLLPVSQAPGAAMLHHLYQRLPTACIDELLNSATAAERQLLTTGKVPRRLGDEIRLYLQQVRLNRAYEGLYLHAVSNIDTERLVLHALPRLPGWSEATTIELRKGVLPAERIDAIGAHDHPDAVITHTANGYQVSSAQASQPLLYPTFYEAAFAALPDAQRARLAEAGIIDATTLGNAIRQAPPLPRWALRKALKMQRPGPRSPMRLADGRLGYRLSGEGKLGEDQARATLLQQLDDLTLAPEFSVTSEQILSALEAAGRPVEQVRQRITQLFAERRELQRSLDSAFEGPGAITGLGARRASREAISAALWRHWLYNAVPELDEESGTLRLHDMHIAEFPQHLPDFVTSRVSRLQLHSVNLDHAGDGSLGPAQFDAQLSRLFRHFPSLEQLEVERDYRANAPASEFANSLALMLRSFPQLGELRLINQNLELFPLDLERFASREQLRRLDLSGNTLAPLANFSFPDLQLGYLGLERMQLQNWPDWLNSAALERVAALSLRDNDLVRVPAFLSQGAAHATHTSDIALQGNPLSPAQVNNLFFSQEGNQHRFSFGLDANPDIEHYTSLRRQLQQWADAAEQEPHSRQQVAQAILELRQQRIRGNSFAPLVLSDIRLEDFPSEIFQPFYLNVESVTLMRVQTSLQQLEAFVQRFPALNELTLNGHVQPLQGLPPIFGQLSSLRRLSLIDQGLEIDQQTLDTLASLPSLNSLDISGNHLRPGLQEPAGAATRVRELHLRNLQLDAWPDWLEEWMPRNVLDLRFNQLTTLPQWLLENPVRRTRSTNILLEGNPLSHDTMRTAHLSQRADRTYFFDMDLPFEILNLTPPESELGSNYSGSFGPPSIGTPHRHGSAPWWQNIGIDSRPWLESLPVADRLRLAQTWQSLEQSSDAPYLLQLVARLTASRAYREPATQSDLVARVWRVLQRAAEDAEERITYDAMATDAIQSGTCADGVLVQFQQIEMQCITSEALRHAAPGMRERSLFATLRGLYRQQALDRIAIENSEGRDAAEVRLAYHRDAANRLELPSPADPMVYPFGFAGDELERAIGRVLAAEQGDEFLAYARDCSFWNEYLHEAYADDFQRIESTFREAVNRLDDSGDLSPAHLSRIRELETQKAEDIRQLLDRLTERARERGVPPRDA